MSDASTIEHLESQIRHHRDLYYNGSPELTDAEFDALEDRLRALAPNSPALAEVGAAPHVAKVPIKGNKPAKGAVHDPAWLHKASAKIYDGHTPSKKQEDDYAATYDAIASADGDDPLLSRVLPPRGYDWPKTRHEIPMGSLNKVNTADELRDWATRCDELAVKAELAEISDDLAVTEKLDGISLEVVYRDGELAAAITRGDGIVGEQITPNVLRIESVPHRIDRKGHVSVRGEIVLRKSDADAMIELRKELDKDFSGELSLRNTAAGAARAKSTKFIPGTRLLSVLIYDLEGIEGVETEQEKFDIIRKLGFVTPSLLIGPLDAIIARYDEYAATLRDQLDYEIDGLVVRANRVRSFALLGELNNRPRAAVAFKFGSEMAVTRLKAITWETGDTGRITPVALVEPVRLVGAQVERASLHNLANVKALDIGVGDEVLISRRNDVIPYVEKVEVKGPNHEQAPTTCGRCEAEVVVDGEYLVCRNDACPARRIGRLKTWINTIGLLEWGEKTFVLFSDLGLVGEPADLYRLTVAQLTEIDGFGEKRARKLLDPLFARKEIPLATFIAALGIETVSKETGKLLVEAGFDSIAAIHEATALQLADIPGLGAIKAEKIKKGIEGRLDEIERLRDVGVIPTIPSEGGPLTGMSFCFSGSHSRPRKVLQNLVESNGGSVRSGVTKGLTYLVLADPTSTSSKAEKARKLGTEVVDEAHIDALLQG